MVGPIGQSQFSSGQALNLDGSWDLNPGLPGMVLMLGVQQYIC